jgi:ribonuclease Z
MHADHVLGVVPILTTIMSGIGVTPEETERLRKLGRDKKARLQVDMADSRQASISTAL